MKKITPWICFMIAASSAVAQNQEGLDAYRQGYYLQASQNLTKDMPDPVVDYYLGRMNLYGYGELKNNLQAIRYFKRAADRGHLFAARFMGRYALNIEQDPAQALVWFKKAADANDLPSQMYCVAAYRNGFGTAKNLDLAQRYTIAAAKNGHALAQYALAESFLNSKQAQNKKLGLSWLEKAVEKDNPAAMFLLGKLYLEGRIVQKNELKGNELIKIAQEKGYVPDDKTTTSQATINPEQAAAAWLSNHKETTLKACGYGLRGILTDWKNQQALEENRYNQPPQMELTERSAIYNPQFALINPLDVPLIDYYDAYMQSLDHQVAENQWDFPHYDLVMPAVTERILEKAILGDSTAQFALGQLYQQGVSVEKNMQEAIKYYNKSAAQQDLRAEYNLALIYLYGETGKPDYQQALGWLTDAAFKGSSDAQYVLGQIYTQGYHDASGSLVIPPDEEQASAMYYLGAANHHARSQYQLAQKLSRESTTAFTVQQKNKRHALLQTLYQDALKAGVSQAKLPLAFFYAMSQDKSQQTEAYNIARQEADAGNPQAYLLLGLLYDRGIGVAASPSTAINYYKKSAANPVTDFILGTYAALNNDNEAARARLTLAQNSGFSYAPLNLAIIEKQQGQNFLPSLLQARDLGNSRASLLLADYYLTQKGDINQLSEVRSIYQHLADQGDANGQLKLGYMFEQGLGGAIDLQEAARWYTAASAQGQAIAQFRLGRLSQLGWLGKQPDYQEAKKWYALAMEQYTPAAVALGFIYDTVDDNYKQAFLDYDIAAKQGDIVGQFNLGLLYEKGKGMPVQFDQAAALYRAAAEKGHVQSMVQLAGLYLEGSIGSRDVKQALNWYQKAAEQGDRDALYHLGVLAETGTGLPIDYTKAIQYYQASSGKGQAQAKLALARMYQSGQGVSRNTEAAIQLYKELSSIGNAYSAYQLATLAYQGALGEQNKLQQTKQWLQVAANLGSKQAEQVLLWLSSQTDERVSFIEPAHINDPQTVTTDAPAYMWTLPVS